MNFYDVLAAEKWDGGIPTMNFFDLLFAQSISGEQWQIYEGTLPATFNANGSNLKQYQVWGNTGGVGDRTENLFDISTATFGKYIDNNGVEKSSTASDVLHKLNHSDFININPETDYIFVYKGSRLTADQRVAFCWYTDSKNFLYRDSYLAEPPLTEYQFSKTSPSNAKYLIINFYGYNNNARYMLTEGSTPLASYVPFGYEVDMAIGSNILQSSEIEWGGWQAAAETIPSKIDNPARCRSKNMYPIFGEKIFYDFKSLNVNIAFVNSGGRSLGGTGFKTGVGSVDVPTNAVKCLFIIANTDSGTNILPAQVIAAEIWASVDATTTPIYIGDEPLDKDEYIDYQAGKIYRYETEMKKDVSQTGWQWRWETDNVTYQATLSNRVSVGRFYPEDTKEYIISAVPDTFEVAVISADSSDVKIADTGWGASWTLSGASAHSFCVTVRKSDSSDITPSEVDGVKFKVTSLTPTDPPVTLPALPTVDGTTIVDYAGESVAPEKVLLEYAKGGN